MTIEEMMGLSFAELQRLSGAELHKIVKASAGTLNRRLQNIKYARGASKIAVKKAEESGGRFGVSGTKSGDRYNRAKLEREYFRERAFYESKQGSVRKAKQYTKEIEKAFGLKKKEATAAELDALREKENEAYKAASVLRTAGDERYRAVLADIKAARRKNKDGGARAIMDALDKVIENAHELEEDPMRLSSVYGKVEFLEGFSDRVEE